MTNNPRTANADEFLELYKHLESAIKERFPQKEGSAAASASLV